jgi:hypothetical protein
LIEFFFSLPTDVQITVLPFSFALLDVVNGRMVQTSVEEYLLAGGVQKQSMLIASPSG